MSKLVVIMPPRGPTVLAQAADLADELGVTLSGDENDPVAARLGALLISASAAVSEFIGRPLLAQTVLETFSREADDFPPLFEWRRRNPVLVLSVLPVVEIEGLIIGGLDFIPPDGFDFDGDAGTLRLPLSVAGYSGLSCRTIAVTYQGGFLLPGADAVGPVLPETIRQAVIDVAAARWLRTGDNSRDLSVVREQTEGIGYTEYAPPPVMVGSLPADVAARLGAYRDVRV